MASESTTTATTVSDADPGSHELDAPPWLRVEATLMRTATAIHNGYDARLEPLGLSLNMASLLAYVQQFGPVSQTRAAEHLSQGRASTGCQADRLEERGLLRRIPDPGDRRVWLLEITDDGRTMVDQINRTDEVFREQLRVGISRDERQQLASLLVRLQRNLSTAATPLESPIER